MKEKNKKVTSLYLEWFLLLFFASIASILFFIGSRFLIEQQIDLYYETHNPISAYNEQYIAQLQHYVKSKHISTQDTEKLNQWIQENRLIYIQIKKDKTWVYSSDFEMDEIKSETYDVLPSSDSYYNVTFRDGEAQVFIMGMYSYKAYMISMIITLILSFLLFLLLTMLGIRRKIRYLNCLSHDIEILEGGSLEYDVHVEGKDEITNLAKSLNAMKTSFSNQIKEVELLMKTNQEMVTELSHDLRTPLTSVLLYAEILKSGQCQNEQEKQKYLDKIIRKIQHMHSLSDRLLSYSVRTIQEPPIPAQYVPPRSGLYDELSELCHFLESEGFRVQTDLHWAPGKLLLQGESVTRILDNIASNLLKYADAATPVLIRNEYGAEEMRIIFQNGCCNQNTNSNLSTSCRGIGLQNIKRMMLEMDGSCEVVQTHDTFLLCLRFRRQRIDERQRQL